VFVADALAWQLHAAGRDREALVHADEALRLGTRNALFHFHRAMIESALGRRDAARADFQSALAINPHFSVIHAPEAVEHLAALGGPD
jgi:Flp pilus assembly protein TadD